MIVRKDEGRTIRKETIRGGRGAGVFTYVLEEAVEGSHFKMVARIRLGPGASIGQHVHDTDEELYYILRGKGTYYENGKAFPVAEGDSLVLYRGGSHGLEASEDEELVFLAIITC